MFVLFSCTVDVRGIELCVLFSCTDDVRGIELFVLFAVVLVT